MRQPFRLLVTGSQTWDDTTVIEHALAAILAHHPGGVLLVHGACPRGADAIAAAYRPDTRIPQRGTPRGLAPSRLEAVVARHTEPTRTASDVTAPGVRGPRLGTLGSARSLYQAGEYAEVADRLGPDRSRSAVPHVVLQPRLLRESVRPDE